MTTTTTQPGVRASRPRSSVTERVVERIAARSDARTTRTGVSRRSFLVGAAIVGSALSISPFRWIMRPTSAYATVCGSGSTCGSGWTAFCCTINEGANTCPPGSYVAGWWKIDNSPFCRGEPRYIIDCNRSPGSSCRCRCASGTCDERRVCCNNFRYGQCNTDVPGVTEVVCRVVVCTTPWTWDPACGRTVRTDNRTVTHNAPCLPGTNPSPIEMRYQDLGLVGSVLGSPIAAEAAGPRLGAWRRYEHGVLAHRSASGTRMLRGALADEYARSGGPSGPLGYPLRDQERVEGADGEMARFEKGDVYLVDGVVATVLGPTAGRYRALGGPAGVLGAPTEGTTPAGDQRGSVTRFVNGSIHASGNTGAHELLGAFSQRFDALGGPAASGLGYPVAGDGGQDAWRFEHGLLLAVDRDVRVLLDPIAARYLDTGGAAGPWGPLTADQQRDGATFRAVFADATVFAGERSAPAALTDPVLAAYLGEGGPDGPLGLPTGDSFVARSGHHRGSFEGGAIEVDPRSGAAHRYERRSTRLPSELTP